jgi:hypothetical protein
MLSFRNLLLPPLVTDRSHVEEFAPNFGVLVVSARMSRTVRRKPMTGFCFRIDGFLPILWSVHHRSKPLKQGDDKDVARAGPSDGFRHYTTKIRLGRLRSLDAGQRTYFSLRWSYVEAERGRMASDLAGPLILGIHMVMRR